MNTSAREPSPSASGRSACEKFSPVPWTAVDNNWDFSTVYDDNGAVVASVRINHLVTEDSQDRYEPIKEANARLIAAAPRMFAALHELYLRTIIGTDDQRHAALDEAWRALTEASPQLAVSESSGASQVPGPTS